MEWNFGSAYMQTAISPQNGVGAEGEGWDGDLWVLVLFDVVFYF